MKVGVVRESAPGEHRVALIPADVPTLAKLNLDVIVESGAGQLAGYTDGEYQSRGATVASRKDVLTQADVLVAVRAAAAAGEVGVEDLKALKNGAIVIGHLNPYESHPGFTVLVEKRATALSMELIPRITRAQSMDALSSQANLAGYKSALLAAEHLPKMFPMMMTAAGTIVPAKVFVVGVGVAGLQAIATAKRLGAVVSAYDIRPAVKEQVQSLGAKFVEMELDAGEAETKGGYAREMNEEFYRKQREMMTSVVAESDAVITTAAIPGKKAPTLVTADMVRGMRSGSVIIDLAAERGGNCELTKVGETVVENGVTIVGPVNVASTIAHNASQLYSRNVTTLLKEFASEDGLDLTKEDEILEATLVLKNGTCPDPQLAETIGVPVAEEAK